ncbi:MAG TPA: hypothetical protein VF519_10260 [Mycobacteriales bacterium]|jgi:hypothetical protein
MAPAGQQADYVLQAQDRRYGPGEGENRRTATIAVVLTFGGPTAHETDATGVIDSGGVILLGWRAESRLSPPDGEDIRVRGLVATLSKAESVTTGKYRRIISWRLQDDGMVLEWQVMDSGARPLNDLVRIVNALVES